MFSFYIYSIYVTEKDWTKGRNIMFFFLLRVKETFKHISLIVILSLFTAWLLFLKTYSHESAFSTATGPKVIYKGDTSKNKLHSRLILVGETKSNSNP